MNFAKLFHKSNSSIHQLQGNVLECIIEQIRGNKVIIDTGMRASFVCFRDELSESSTIIVIAGPFTARKIMRNQLRLQRSPLKGPRIAKTLLAGPFARIGLSNTQMGLPMPVNRVVAGTAAKQHKREGAVTDRSVRYTSQNWLPAPERVSCYPTGNSTSIGNRLLLRDALRGVFLTVPTSGVRPTGDLFSYAAASGPAGTDLCTYHRELAEYPVSRDGYPQESLEASPEVRLGLAKVPNRPSAASKTGVTYLFDAGPLRHDAVLQPKRPFISFLKNKPSLTAPLEIVVCGSERHKAPALYGSTHGVANSAASTRATDLLLEGSWEAATLGLLANSRRVKRPLRPSIIDCGPKNASFKSGKKTTFISATKSVGVVSSMVEPDSPTPPSHPRSRKRSCVIGVEEKRSPLTGEFTCSAPKSMEKISKRKLVWTELSKLWRINVRMKGFILNSVNGGYAVAIAGYIAFLPKSLCINKKVFIGQWRQFAIIGMNAKIANIVVKEIGTPTGGGGRTFISKPGTQRSRRLKDRNSSWLRAARSAAAKTGEMR